MVLAIVAVILSFVPQCMIFCCRHFARKVPTNYLLLCFFTLLQTVFFMWVTAHYDRSSVLMAAGMALGMTIAITIYACFTKTDFTVCGSLFLVLSFGFLLLSFISIFMTFVSWWHPVVSAVAVALYGLYIIYDT